MRGFSGVRGIQLLLLLGATEKHFSGEVCSVFGSDGHHEAEQCSLVLRMIIRETRKGWYVWVRDVVCTIQVPIALKGSWDCTRVTLPLSMIITI